MKLNFTRLSVLIFVAFLALACASDNTDNPSTVISVSPMEVKLQSFAGATVKVKVISNVDYAFQVQSECRSWLSASIDGEYIVAKALERNEGDERQAMIQIVLGTGLDAIMRTVIVTQLEGERLPEHMEAEPYYWSPNQDKLYYPFLTDYTGSLNPATATFQQGKTRIVPYLIGYEADSSIVLYRSRTNKYGSRTDKATHTATGHFYTKKINGRWFLIDPEGYIHHHHGVTSVRKGSSGRNASAWDSKYGNNASWMKSIQQDMADLGIHGTGAFCHDTYQIIQDHNTANPDKPLILCPSFGFISAFRNHLGVSNLGGKAALNCALAFHPDWKAFCKQYLQTVLAPYKDDPNTMGFYSDNELLFTDDNDKYISKEIYANVTDPTHPARIALDAWMASKGLDGTSLQTISFATNGEFAGIVAEAYYKGVREALDELGYKTLYFGSRLHGNPKGIKSIIEAAGRHCDVISINLYGYWDITNVNHAPTLSRVYEWHQWTDCPFFISEFYTRAVESDLPNTSGGGYLVRKFKDRAYVYQHITLGLIESKHCVGWTWFKYQDDDGTDNDGKPANKGLYDNSYELYPWLASYMKAVNVNAFELMEYFEGTTY